MKKIPIGVEDFKTITTEDYYYIDKTRFIEEVIRDGAVVKLFTRPRRFGKTLNMSMLKYFFDIENAEENRKLFKNLYIENSPVMDKQGKYPVIFISLKGINGNSWKKAVDEIKIKISELFDEYKFLLEELDEFDKNIFREILLYRAEEAQLKNSFKFLTKLLKNHYKKKVIVLIDEYDSPLISAYEHGYYSEAVGFFKSLYGDVLKTNSSLEMGVMTGIIRVVRAGIFSDLNNIKVNTILSESYDDSFGLLENEVKTALNAYGMEYNIEEVKNWYNGYKFGNIKLYNPWSIINYIDNKKLGTYWIDTSENYLIKDILKLADDDIFSKLNLLLTGKEIKEEITGKSNLKDILDIHDVWELLLFSGYLTIDKVIDDSNYFIKIPNNEVKEFFKDSFIEVTFGSNTLFRNMLKNLVNNNIEGFEKNLQNIMINYMSFNDVAKLEKVYHSFVLGLILRLIGEYRINSNGEGGLGRYDILIEPVNKNKRAFILEFKVADKEEKLEKKADEAVQQIEDKKYYLSVKEKGIENITILGIAFYKKILKIKSKQL